MWAVAGVVLVALLLSAKCSLAQDSRLDHVYPETENSGLEVMQENPCPKGCAPEKRARSMGAGGVPLLDVLSRRSALDKNFMRFGRTPPDTSSPSRDDNVYRASRAKNTNFIRLGRAGRQDNFMRFGRRDDFMRFGRRDDFMRFGRKDDFMRFGRQPGNKLRFGRGPEDEAPEDDHERDRDLSDDQEDDDRRWKRNARHQDH